MCIGGCGGGSYKEASQKVLIGLLTLQVSVWCIHKESCLLMYK